MRADPAPRTKRPRWITIGLPVVIAALVVVSSLWWPPSWQPTSAEWWLTPSANSRTLVAGVMSASQNRVSVAETATEVRLTCWTRPKSTRGLRLLPLILDAVVVQLRSPLDGRAVVDQDGNPIPEKVVT